MLHIILIILKIIGVLLLVILGLLLLTVLCLLLFRFVTAWRVSGIRMNCPGISVYHGWADCCL